MKSDIVCYESRLGGENLVIVRFRGTVSVKVYDVSDSVPDIWRRGVGDVQSSSSRDSSRRLASWSSWNLLHKSQENPVDV